jgi:hypothetical protein
LKFFADGCVSVVHVRALCGYFDAEGNQFCHLTEKFSPDVPDPEWLSSLAKERGWVILSGDTRIISNPANKAAWHESGMTAFFFGAPWAETKRLKQAEELLRWIPRIIEVARKHPVGHGFIMDKRGREPRQIYPDVRKRQL